MVECCDGCGRCGVCDCSLSSSVVVLLLLSEISLVGNKGKDPAVEWQACQDGRGSQSADFLVVAWQGKVNCLSVGTSMFCLMLHGSSCAGSHIGQSLQWDVVKDQP